MKAHTNSFKEQIKLIGKEIDSRITFGDTVLGKDDLNAVTPSYQGAILKSVMKQLDIDSNVAIPIGTILKYEFGLKVNGEYEYINYGNYIVYSIEKQEDTNSYKIVCYDKLLYSMLDYVKLPITYPISIRDYINVVSTALGLTFANKSETFANYDKQIQADLYDGLGYTFRDILDELAQVTASTICLNNNDELEIRYITETGDTIDEEFLKDVNVNFGEKFGAVNTIVLSRSGDSDSVYYPEVLPANPYEIKISDNQIMNGNDRADFLPDIYNKLNGLEFYTNDFVSTGICYYDLCDRYSVKVGDTTYSCVMFNDEVLVTQGLEENVYTELPKQTETDYKHASKDDRMINQVYIIAKKNEAEILALVSTTETIQKEINPTKNESGSNITIEDASDNPLTYLEIEGKSTQETRSGKNVFKLPESSISNGVAYTKNADGTFNIEGTATSDATFNIYVPINESNLIDGEKYTLSLQEGYANLQIQVAFYNETTWLRTPFNRESSQTIQSITNTVNLTNATRVRYMLTISSGATINISNAKIQLEAGSTATEYEAYGASPSPDFPSEIESVGYENLFNNIASSATINGLTFTINEDKSITINGIATATTNFKFTNSITLPVGTYTLSGCPDGGSWETYRITSYNGQHYDFGSNKTFTITENLTQEWYIQIYSGATLNNMTFYPMLEKGTIAHSYIPYGKYGIEVKTTNGTDTNTSVIVLNAPLRNLSNGVKDIAYMKNNKLYVRRCVGNIILNGSEWWIKSSYSDDTYFCGYMNDGISDANYEVFVMNDTFSKGLYSEVLDKECMADRQQLHIRILANRLTANSVDGLKKWLSEHNVQVDYELDTPVTEEIGEIEMPSTFKGINHISTTDELLPIINLNYVRDTVIADYVENHVTELKLTENEIKASVESVSSSVDGLNTTINRVEEITNDNSQVINVISTNIDKTSGEVREVTTTTGFTFNADGMTIDDGSGFKAEHTADGTYYKDGNSIVGQYTKDGSKQKDLELFGTYSYGKESIEDTPMFVGQLYTDANGERGFGHFYNGEG